MEHRWGLRQAVNCPVRIRTRGGLIAPGRVCNVSISGAFVLMPLPVALLSYVEILIPQRQGRAMSTAIEGQVVRRTETGFGLEWCVLAPQALLSMVVPAALDRPAEKETSGVPSQGRR